MGVRWLPKRLSIYPNAYYNYLKHRKSVYHARKSQIKDQIQSIYHEHGGVDGYRQMKVYLKRRNINLSALTVHRYINCTIIDLHDRSVVASITDRNITSEFAIRTLRKAIESQSEIKGVLILHSDQGSQYTSKDFTEYCKRMAVTQSMSKAGYPYDNAPMERYFNTLKNELIYQHEYQTEEALYTAIEEFAYTTYNHRRPHSYNNYKTPFEARKTA